MKRSEIRRLLEKEAGDVEDLHESFTELVVDLEKEVGVMYQKLLEKEKAFKPGVSLIEHFVSKGESSLILRADAIPEKDYARLLHEFKGFSKKVEKEYG